LDPHHHPAISWDGFSWNLRRRYICVAEKATGFRFNETTKEWVQAKFKAVDKYIIRKSKMTDFFKYEVVKEGKRVPNIFCRKPFDKEGHLFCSGFLELYFSKKNGRYLIFHPYGYWNSSLGEIAEEKESGGTPFIEIGKCSPF
jgi:hypothetical protein